MTKFLTNQNFSSHFVSKTLFFSKSIAKCVTEMLETSLCISVGAFGGCVRFIQEANQNLKIRIFSKNYVW